VPILGHILQLHLSHVCIILAERGLLFHLLSVLEVAIFNVI